MSNRRRFARVRAHLRLAITWTGPWPITWAPASAATVYWTTEISAGGALVALEPLQQPPLLRSTGTAALVIDGTEHQLAVQTVRHVPAAFAVRFLGMSPTEEDHLAAYVMRLEAQWLSRRIPT